MKSNSTKICQIHASSFGKNPLWRLGLVMLLSTLLVMQGCKKPEPEPTPVTTPGLQLVYDGLVSPLGVFEAPDDSKRLFILDQIGKVWIISKDGTRLPNPFIDVSSKMVTLSPGYDERGLLGFAFHPNFKANGKFYVYYNGTPRSGGPAPGVNWNCVDRVSEFKVSGANPNLADLSSERVILNEDDPQSNHNGGTIAFGPDNYLYIAIGDGGGANDNPVGHVSDWYTVNTGGNGQDVYANLLGNILRIDINSATTYNIPADNPFVGKPGKDEIYAYGFRNPYRFSFDKEGTHQLIVGDVGQNLWEEVDVVRKGGNYGWNVKEGTHCFNTETPLTERASCPMVDTAGNPLIDPVMELPTAGNPVGGLGTAVIGGNIYRGNDLPALKGKYIFGIFTRVSSPASGRLFIATPEAVGKWSFSDFGIKDYPDNLGMYLKGFGENLSGELYITTTGNQGPSGTTGKVFKLVNASPKG